METLLALTYATLCWLTFKVFKVKVNKWSITTAVLGGVIMIGALVLLMNYNHPFTSNGRVYFVSTPVITEVSAQVDSVYIQHEGQSVRKGDTLFSLVDSQFRHRVAELEAQMKLTNTRLAESKKLASVNAGSKYDVEAYGAELEELQAKLDQAQYNLDACMVRSYGDGFVTQNRLRPGMRAVQFPLRPIMTIVDTKQHFIVGAFPQNPLQRIKVGDEAEVIFDAIPGRIFKAKVQEIGKYIANGELQAFGNLYNFDSDPFQGSVPVVVDIEEDMSAYNLPGGAKIQMAIYSEHVEPVALMRKVLFRMKGWMNYIFGEH